MLVGLGACGKLRDWPKAVELLGRAERLEEANVVTYNLALNACAKAGQAEAALELLQVGDDDDDDYDDVDHDDDDLMAAGVITYNLALNAAPRPGRRRPRSSYSRSVMMMMMMMMMMIDAG
jgi:hypothetical protein